MATYTHEYSTFPDRIMERTTFKNITDSMASIVNTIKSLQAVGNYQDADALIAANKDTLKEYILTMEYLNFLDEETRNVEIFLTSLNAEAPLAQSVFYQTTEPSNAKKGDVWLK